MNNLSSRSYFEGESPIGNVHFSGAGRSELWVESLGRGGGGYCNEKRLLGMGIHSSLKKSPPITPMSKKPQQSYLALDVAHHTQICGKGSG